MGKTVRYDPETKRKGKKPKKSEKSAWCNLPTKAKSDEPEQLSGEWAVRRMKDRINYEFEKLIEIGKMPADEKSFYVGYVEDQIRKNVHSYDPEYEKDGRKCSMTHYVRTLTDWLIMNVRKHFNRDKCKVEKVPITDAPIEEAEETGMISTESLSDECRSVRELEFKMDVATLRSILTKEERIVLNMRLEGYSNTEIGEAINRDRHRVEKTLLPHIQEVARKCGFFPRSEARKNS